jgi:glutathione S-transferase
MLKLVIGTKNYSSWSLRPWLLMAHHQLDFEEALESLAEPNLSSRLKKHSPSARVPVLIDKELHIWDSLAICEYISEQYLNNLGWPSDTKKRAHARSLVCEMHAGFTDLRNNLPMNCRAKRRVTIDHATQQDIDRVQEMWSYCYANYGGPYLMGNFSIVDCFYAPVAMRFITYQVPLTDTSRQFINALLNNPAMKQWLDAAYADDEVVPEDESGVAI